MNSNLKKLKHLRTTMLDYANENFHNASISKWPDTFITDFDIVDDLEQTLNESGYLTKESMKKCNQLYRFYRVVYENQ